MNRRSTLLKIALVASLSAGCGGRAESETLDNSAEGGMGGAATEFSSSPDANGGTTSATSRPNPSGGAVGSTVLITTSGGATTTTLSATTCQSTLNFVELALSSQNGNWVGGVPYSTMDDPCGVQGFFYAASDDGMDQTAGTADDSLLLPQLHSSTTNVGRRDGPCQQGKCFIKGTTHPWPRDASGLIDYTASVWGAVFGLSLNGMEPDSGGVRRPYSGPIRGFIVTTSGFISGQAIRFAYTQQAEDNSPPFLQSSSLGTMKLLFTDVSCPAWSSSCTGASMTPYDLQIQVVGGDVAGNFFVSVDSITPII